MSDSESAHDRDKDKTKDDPAVECCSDDKALERSPSVRKKLRALAFGTQKKGSHSKETKKKKSSWTSKLNSKYRHINSDALESSVSCSSCICTSYKKTDDDSLAEHPDILEQSVPKGTVEKVNDFNSVFQMVPVPSPQGAGNFHITEPPPDDWDELARQERAKEIEEGIEPPPGYHLQASPSNQIAHLSDLTRTLSQQLNLSVTPYPCLERLTEAAGFSQAFFKFWERQLESFQSYPTTHSQIDYVHCLVPDLLEVTNCCFYWGKMDRYEAEKLLDKRAEGTFLLRDSAQEEFLFSVSFRRYGRTLHARIEQWNHKFSFDSHDPGVFASDTVCGLIEHYKDPSCCMFFEPMLTLPLNRSFVFPLQHLCRSVVCSCLAYDGISVLNLPKKLKFYLKEYHYKQRVRVRHFDIEQ